MAHTHTDILTHTSHTRLCCCCPVNACINLENLCFATHCTCLSSLILRSCRPFSLRSQRSLFPSFLFPLPSSFFSHCCAPLCVCVAHLILEIGSCFSFDLLFAFLLPSSSSFSSFSLLFFFYFFCVSFYRAILGYLHKGDLQQVSSCFPLPTISSFSDGS